LSIQIDRRAVLAFAAMTAFAPAACAKDLKASDWRAYKQRFMASDGRVIDTGNGGVSHSEGQGFAMLLALGGDDRAAFTALWQWTQTHLTRADSGLFAWRFEPAKTPPVQDPNNATDGDILIAWALLRAAKVWNVPEYSQASETLRAAILREACTIHAGRRVLLPGRLGFVADEVVTLNPSYYVWPALDAFAAFEPLWNDVISDGMDLVNAAAFGTWGLPTDWIEVDAAGLVQPARDRPARFGFDAVRVPLYLRMSGRSAELQRFAK
jgi:endoglucanase